MEKITKRFQREDGNSIPVEILDENKTGYTVEIIESENRINIVPSEHAKMAATVGMYSLLTRDNAIFSIDGYTEREKQITKDYAGTTYLKYVDINQQKQNKKIKSNSLFMELCKIYVDGCQIRGW